MTDEDPLAGLKLPPGAIRPGQPVPRLSEEQILARQIVHFIRHPWEATWDWWALRDIRKLDRSFDRAKNADCYVAFVDLLGFSHRVVSDFEETIELYRHTIIEAVILSGYSKKVNIRVYSDAFLITSADFAAIAYVVNYLHMCALRNDYLVRGGIGFGRHFEARNASNLYIVSTPLVKAVGLEKTVKHPCVVVDQEIEIPSDLWGPAAMPNIDRPVLFYEGQAIINPCHQYWGTSARMRVEQMLENLPQHAEKYRWFLRFHDAIFSDVPLIPQKFIDDSQNRTAL